MLSAVNNVLICILETRPEDPVRMETGNRQLAREGLSAQCSCDLVYEDQYWLKTGTEGRALGHSQSKRVATR